MIKTSDEIMLKLAAILDVPIPEIPKTKELELMEPEKITEEKKISLPIELPEDIKIKEPEIGSAEWMAKYHTQQFLKGTKQPWRGWIRDPVNKNLVIRVMNDLVENNPENYFDWDLHRRFELQKWLYPSAKSLIKKDPIGALMREIYRFSELQNLQTDLWKSVFEKEIGRSVMDETVAGKIFSGKILNRMRHLAGRIANTDPEFYNTYIKGKKITTKQFDEIAERNIKNKKSIQIIKILIKLANELDKNGLPDIADEIDNISKELLKDDNKERVKKAFQNTPNDYLSKLLSTRNPGPNATGSCFLSAQTIDSLSNADWKEYSHSDVKEPATAFIAPIPGYYGIVELSDLPKNEKVKLIDPKNIGKLSVAVGPGFRQKTNHTVVLLGPMENKEIVWTIFPGDPILSSEISSDLIPDDKKTITVDEAIELGFKYGKIES